MPVDHRGALGAIPADMVHKSFKKCTISNSLDGIEADYSFESDEALIGSSDSGESGDD